jgi:hypothetical protein
MNSHSRNQQEDVVVPPLRKSERIISDGKVYLKRSAVDLAKHAEEQADATLSTSKPEAQEDPTKTGTSGQPAEPATSKKADSESRTWPTNTHVSIERFS